MKTSFLKEQGNIKLSQLYDIIRFQNNKPDLLAIDLYSDIRSWYKPKKFTEDSGNITYISKLKSRFYKTSYCYLSKKYHVSKETIRSKLVKLEDLGLLNRVFTVEKRYYEREENNILNILVWKKTPYFESFIGLEKAEDLLDICYKKNRNKELEPSPDKTGDIYGNNNNLSSNILKKDSLDNISESNFVKSNLKEDKGGNSLKNDYSNIIKTRQSSCSRSSKAVTASIFEKVKAKFIGNKRRSIAELSPITEDEACSLRLTSKREFNLSYMNKLKEKLGEKHPGNGFFTRAKFLEYMSKTIAFELRDATIVNNETFRFKTNDDKARKQNYLRKVEESKNTDKQSQLRKKIAGSFDSEIAYDLLTNWTYKGELKNNIFQLPSFITFDLSKNQQATLLSLVRSVYSVGVEKVEFMLIDNSKIKKPESNIVLNLGKEGSMWNRISTKLLEYYGEGIHKSWFSKLEAEEDEYGKMIRLRAPTNFIKDWMITNYKSVIERFCEEENYYLNDVYA